MTPPEGSEQAAPQGAGDAPAAPVAGQPVATSPIIPVAATKAPEEPKKPDAAPAPTPPENDAAKQWRKSDKEWQEMVEATTKSKEMMEAFAKAFNEAPKPSETMEDMVRRVAQEQQSLRHELDRTRWEAEHPASREERYKEAWESVNKEPRFSSLTYDERWKLVKNQDASGLSEELLNQVKKMEGSVAKPGTSSTSGPRRPSPELLESGKAWGFSEEDYEKAGVF